MRSVKIRQPQVNKKWALFAQYPYIYAWGMHMGSYESYIMAEIEKAIAQKAPRTAIFFHHTTEQKWCTIDECKNAPLKEQLILNVNAQFPDNNIL